MTLIKQVLHSTLLAVAMTGSLLVCATCIAMPEVTEEVQVEQIYMRPPDEIAAVVDAPFPPTISLSPDRSNILIKVQPGLPGIDEVSQPELRIAGLRINPRNFGPSRSRYLNQIKLRALIGGEERVIAGLPENPKINSIEWSPDGTHLALLLTFAENIELWTIDVETASASRLLPNAINDTYSNPYAWMPCSKALLATVVPDRIGKPPEEPVIPTGPVIQQSLGRRAPARTYQDLIQNKHDEALFEHYATSQLVLVALDGTVHPLGAPALIDSAEPSPDGSSILVQTTRKPFSYTVPAYRFPRAIEVWNTQGDVIHTVAELALADDVPIPFGSVRKGPRSVSWRADVDSTLVWAEALDGGDAGAEVELRDRLFLHEAPFTGEPQAVLDLDLRFREVYWSNDNLALATGFWWQTRKIKVWRLAPGTPSNGASVVMDYSYEDRYNDPGKPLLVPTPKGTSVLLTDNGGSTIFLAGRGASPEGDRPFLDEMNLASGETTRVFHSQAPNYENPVMLLDLTEKVLLFSRESKNIQPNYWIRSLSAGDEKQITTFSHPNPQFARVQKELIRYTRDDGVELTAKLYLPAGYEAEKDGPLPMLMWAYPREFKSAAAASQVTGSPHRFVRVTYWSPTLWLLRDYAVLDGPTMPIVGEGDEEPNDTFRKQLVASAKAAVDEVVRRGVGDPERLCIGGHSYGAFMTGNLLAHSDLFRAGIARSGAYNRTLTPFGFQAEERTVWQAPEIYFAMSPFMHAEKVNEPILLIHGEADNNSGTFPLQSRRYYSALKGLGATVRLCMLPHESHGYRARESMMHMLWETSEWMDRYVKNAEPRETPK
ncbi:MAG: S9 family peptidase [bacterium]|nr:S9 family peptidase [bacterium]